MPVTFTMSNTKVKGLLKGLRYISQMFDEEKEQDIQIGYPTDVKHVAHVGWDDPSVNSAPSWMNEFKQPGNSSGPLNNNGVDKRNNSAVKCVSEDSRSGARAKSSQERSSPDVPKSSRRQASAGGYTDSPSREKSSKPKQSRRSAKSKESSTDSTKQSSESMDTSQGNAYPARNLPDIPKKTRRKKSKESSTSSTGSGATKSRLKRTETDQTSSNNRRKSFEGEEGELARYPEQLM